MEIMLIIVGLFAAFYFILLRPVLQQQKAQRRELADLQVGDEVMMTGGIFAVVAGIDIPEEGSPRLTLEIAPGVRIQAVPNAVLSRVPERQPASADHPELARDASSE